MTTRSWFRGHEVRWIEAEKCWVYADDGSPTEIERQCKRCGRPPTAEGHDACLGEIPGVTAACCGHGVLNAEYFETGDVGVTGICIACDSDQGKPKEG